MEQRKAQDLSDIQLAVEIQKTQNSLQQMQLSLRVLMEELEKRAQAEQAKKPKKK